MSNAVGKSPLGSRRRRWEDNIKNRSYTRWVEVDKDCMGEGMNKCPVVVKVVMNLRFTYSAGRFVTP